MERSDDLDRKLRDPEFWCRSEERGERAASYYGNALGLGPIRLQLDQQDCENDVVALACGFFTLAKVAAILSHERRMFDETDLYISGFGSTEGSFYSGLVLAQTVDATVGLMCIKPFEIELGKAPRPDRARRSISFGGGGVVYRLLKGPALDVRIWQVPEFGDGEDLREGRLRPAISREFAFGVGDELVLTRWQSLEFLGSSGYALLLRIQLNRNVAPLALEFDAVDLALIGTSASTREASRLQMLATAMRLFDRHDAIPEIEQLLAHPLHFVRWHAMRELLGIDSAAAHPHLLRLPKDDPQPSVRRAALATLQRYFPPEAAGPPFAGVLLQAEPACP